MADRIEAERLASLALSKRRTVRRPAADVRASSEVALGNGGVIVQHPGSPDAPQHIAWDRSGDCMRPVLLDQMGEGHYEAAKGREVRWQPNRSLSILARCRACPSCLRARARYWQARGIAECLAAQAIGGRNWFNTLTYRPDVRYRRLLETRARLGQDVFERLSPDDQFRELVRTCGQDVTKFYKRLRIGGVRFRYQQVTEAHKDGFPHFHLLMHETDPLHPLRSALLERQWEALGFSFPRIVRDVRGGARYVTKYLAKEALTRVRASGGYGGDESDPACEEGVSF